MWNFFFETWQFRDRGDFSTEIPRDMFSHALKSKRSRSSSSTGLRICWRFWWLIWYNRRSHWIRPVLGHYYEWINSSWFCKFGWIISGPTSDSSSSGNNVASHLWISGAPQSIERNNEIVSVLGRFWETESIGIKNDPDSYHEKPTEREIVGWGRIQWWGQSLWSQPTLEGILGSFSSDYEYEIRHFCAKRTSYAYAISYWGEKVVAVAHLSTTFCWKLVVLSTTFYIPLKVSLRCSSSRVICGNIDQNLRRLSSAFFQAVAYVITGNFELHVVTKLAILDVWYVNKHCELHREIVVSVWYMALWFTMLWRIYPRKFKTLGKFWNL